MIDTTPLQIPCEVWFGFSNCARLHNLLPIPRLLQGDERLISAELCFLNKVLGLLLCLWWWQFLNILSIMDFLVVITASPTEGRNSMWKPIETSLTKHLSCPRAKQEFDKPKRESCFKQHEWQMENAIWHGKPCLENGDQFAVLQQSSLSCYSLSVWALLLSELRNLRCVA